MRRLFPFLAAFVLAPVLAAFAADTSPASASLPDGLYADITTPRGSLVLSLDYKNAPLTVTNFVGLAEGTLGPKIGKPYFDGLKFDRVVPNFVVQGGDPLGTGGDGGPGYTFPDEFSPVLHHDAAGVLSMANDGPDTNGSQFFITLREVNRLNYLHSVFGRIVTGAEVLPKIRKDDLITSVHIHRVGAEAVLFRADAAAFATLVAKTKAYAGEPLPGPQSHFDDPDHLLPTEPPRARAFNFKLNNFQRATGVKIYARLFAKFTPATPGQRVGSFTGQLARELRAEKDGLVVAYFADTDSWSIWIGDDYVNRFIGRDGSVKELMQAGAFHDAKRAFFTAAKKQAELYTAEAAQASSDKPLTPAQKIKYQVDAVLEALIFKFEPATATTRLEKE